MGDCCCCCCACLALPAAEGLEKEMAWARGKLEGRLGVAGQGRLRQGLGSSSQAQAAADDDVLEENSYLAKYAAEASWRLGKWGKLRKTIDRHDQNEEFKRQKRAAIRSCACFA